MLKRFWILVVLLPVTFGGYSFFAVNGQPSYSAVATIVPNSQASHVAGLAESEASVSHEEYPDVEVEAAFDSAKAIVTIAASGNSPEMTMQCANMVALEVIRKAEAFYADIPVDAEIPFAAELNAAQTVQESGLDRFGFILVAIAVGLVAALCILVLVNMVRRPVLSKESVEEAEKLPFFCECADADCGARIMANIHFSLAGFLDYAVCLVPLSTESGSDDVIKALKNSTKMKQRQDSLPLHVVSSSEDSRQFGTDVITVIESEPLSSDIHTAYVAEKAGITILVVREWVDSMKELEAAVEQLKRAHANLVGFIYCATKLHS